MRQIWKGMRRKKKMISNCNPRLTIGSTSRVFYQMQINLPKKQIGYRGIWLPLRNADPTTKLWLDSQQFSRNEENIWPVTRDRKILTRSRKNPALFRDSTPKIENPKKPGWISNSRKNFSRLKIISPKVRKHLRGLENFTNNTEKSGRGQK